MSESNQATIGHVLHRLVLAGAEVLAADLARKLRGQYRFVFLCLDEVGPLGERLKEEGFTVLSMDRHPGVDLSVARGIRRASREHGIDLLHAHQYTPFFYSAVSRGLLGRPKVLFTEHGRHYPDQRRAKRVLANKVLLRGSDRVTAVGAFVKQALEDNEGIAPGRVRVVYNGIDPDEHGPDPAARVKVRQELQVGPDEPVILQVARFHSVKDHATALRGFAVALTQHPDALLVLVGDGPERPRIEALIKELGIGHRTRLMGVRGDVPRLMAAGDLFMLSSLSEGISVTLLEAMGAELPIVATDVGGNGEVVEHMRTGLLSPREDHQALGENISVILGDRSMARKMGQAGIEKLHKQFTQNKMHESYAGIYREMLGTNRRA